jgi:hypothetical protein
MAASTVAPGNSWSRFVEYGPSLIALVPEHMEGDMATSWWANPEVQSDRAKFSDAVKAQEPSWVAEANEIGKVMSGVGMGDWSITAPKRPNGLVR